MVIGTQSYLAYAYNQGSAPKYPYGLVYYHVPLIEESMEEGVSPAVSSFMPRDRTGHKVLQGKRSVEGNVVTELDMPTFAEWLGVFAGNTVSFVDVTVPNFPSFGNFSEGDYYKGSNGSTYLCIRGGNISSPQSLNHTEGDEFLEETRWRFVGDDIDLYQQTSIGISNDPTDIPFTLIKTLITTDCGNPIVKQMLFPDCAIDAVELSMNSGGSSRMTWDIVGKRAFDVTGNEEVVSSLYPRGSTEVALSYEAYAYLNNGKRNNIRSFRTRMSNQIERSAFTLGERFRKDLPKMDAVVEGSLDMFVEDSVDMDLMRLEKDFSLTLSMIAGVFHSTIHLPRCKYMGGDLLPSISNRVSSVNMDFRAFTMDKYETPVVITIKRPKF